MGQSCRRDVLMGRPIPSRSHGQLRPHKEAGISEGRSRRSRRRVSVLFKSDTGLRAVIGSSRTDGRALMLDFHSRWST